MIRFAGTITFTPDPMFVGTAGFDYTVSDGSLTDTGHVTVSVTTPTAADASITGRVATPGGQGIAKVRIIVSGGKLATPRTGVTSAFGYYRIDGLEAGQTYVVQVGAKRHSFITPVRTIFLGEDAADVNFIGELP